MDKTEVKTENYPMQLFVPPKSILRQACETPSWKNGGLKKLLSNISFDRGILAGIPNKFELSFGSDLSFIKVDFAPTIWKSKMERVEVIGMKISFIVDGIVQHSEEMIKKSQAQFFSSTNDRIWVDSVTEVKIDISVTRHSKLQSVMPAETSSTRSAACHIHNDRGLMDLSAYFLSNNLSDVSVKCGSETFPAHLFILGYHSEVFAKMFEDEMKEKREDRCVEIKEFSSKAVVEMLRYFYTLKVENMDAIVPFQLFELGDRYMVKELKTLAANFLSKNVNINNALEIYYFSRKHDIHFLKEVAKKVLRRNRKQLVKSYNSLVTFMESVPDDDARDDLFNLLMGCKKRTTPKR